MVNLCMNCMAPMKKGEDICPHCGLPSNSSQDEPFIAKRSVIGDRYILGKGLSQDSEGLSYLGYDFVKEMKVYVKEFFPSEFCERGRNGEVKIKDTSLALENFKSLMKDFLKYFRSVARLRNLPALSAVYDILEENNTCYIIIEWVEGISLDMYLNKMGGSLQWNNARLLFMPLLSSLSRMESAGTRHLGICPENMIVTPENKIKLTGFSTFNLRTTGSLIERKLYNGCSALEQYFSDTEITESTDVYGFAASLFFALTGEYPLSAVERKKKDRLLMPSNLIKEIPENVISALANALRINPSNRTLSFETLRVELSNSPVLQVKNIYDSPDPLPRTKVKHEEPNSNMNVWGIISCLSATLILMGCFGIYWFWLKDKNIPVEQSTQSSEYEGNQGNNSGNNLDSSSEEIENIKVDTPQLVGKSVNEAQSAASSANSYKVVVLSEEFHDSIEEGNIISQSPAYGEKMYPGAIIAVNVSKGPEKRVLPSISGKTLSEASLILTDAKFKPSKVSEASKDYAEGIVIGYQDHKAGDLVDYGSEIVIKVSKG